jgi:superfamily II DNA or RNA helicase
MTPGLAGEAVFLPGDPPRAGALALWGPGVDDADDEVELVLPAGRSLRRRREPARLVPLAEALPGLLALRREDAPESLAAWATVATAAVSLVARGRLLPAASPGGYDAWRVGPLDPEDAAWLAATVAALPATAHALPLPGSRPLRLRCARTLVEAMLDGVADVLVRSPAAAATVASPLFAAPEPISVTDRPGLADWLADTGRGLDAGARTGLRLEPNPDDDETLRAVLQLRSTADPSLVVDVADLWDAPAAVLTRLGEQAETDLLLALRRGAAAWPPLGAALSTRTPTALDLDDGALAELFGPAADALGGAGIEVLWPAELLSEPPALRAVVSTPKPADVTEPTFTLEELLEFSWQLTLDGEALTDDELATLASAKRPLVRLRGRWVRADPALLETLRRRRQRPRRLRAGEALAAALTGGVEVDGERVEVLAEGGLADIADRLRALAAPPPAETVPPPEDLAATLRPYQARGLTWLARMTELGLGACLADDMGLGKTVQVIALHLHRRDDKAGPTLVVCPTSLLGNWEREVRRFAPGVPVRRYHGGARHLDDVATDEVVLASYGVLRRDRAALAEVGWGLVVADEAQHAKNPLSRTARELRALPAPARVALTGTPVENRLSELWSILDWTTPGLLGPLEAFRRQVAVPVERYRDADATERLARLVRPFLLRRRKSDPGIAPELPRKTETDRIVPLTPEQGTLYQAVVDETLERISRTTGMDRRGLVLQLLTALKQICDHPALYLRETEPLASRSGKLAALDEITDVVLAEDESMLLFTQYVGMGRLLERHLAARGVRTAFLHGQVPVARREAMVDAFQAGDAPVFLLSLKAGGTGLNLTRASHVVHYDRWWNPAVEDQATDRAYRIGQDRPVQVHRMVTEGTVEDRVAALLAAKRELADAVVGSGEGWLTELGDDELADLVRLGDPA